ncbi:MAG: DNA topoisomerase VI subunit B [archaeon]|nr:DNA topoisomerase VI subunit B [archaeon]
MNSQTSTSENNQTTSDPEERNTSTTRKLIAKQQEISVSEFFEKNKHILGFGSKSKSLLMGVKEAVDNSLDACEETGILPDITVKILRFPDDEYKIFIEDNGPGVPHEMIPNVFGRLLFGSRFHSLRQSRGQQGIGISATIMYGFNTTGKPAHIRSKIKGKNEIAWEMDLSINIKTNRPIISNERSFAWEDKAHGTSIEYTTKGRYITGKQSIFEYLKNTAIVNPHVKIVFVDPEEKMYVFERASDVMPVKSKEIKPHLSGMEIGDILRLSQNTPQRNVRTFLLNDFSSVTSRLVKEILRKSNVSEEKKPFELTYDDAKNIIRAIETCKIMAPPVSCLSPIGDVLIKKGLMNVLEGMRPAYYAPPVTRAPKSISGNPFIIEVGIVYGGDIPSDGPVTILRIANRVPLLFQSGACAITKAIADIDWRRYGLEQRGGKGIPYGPAIFLVHIASTKVPFTSEGKEAVADIPEISREVQSALKFCARSLKSHLNKTDKKEKIHTKFRIVREILPNIARKLSDLLDRPIPDLSETISKIMNVVWVESSAVTNKKNKVITYGIYNYTNTEKSLCIHTRAPKNSVNSTLFQSPYFTEISEDGKITWTIGNIPPAKYVEISFELEGKTTGISPESDVYVSGINSLIVIGAEQLPGDWNIKETKITKIDSSFSSNTTIQRQVEYFGNE